MVKERQLQKGEKILDLLKKIADVAWSIQSSTKHLDTFSLFSTICLHHKWNGTRLLSPESECTSCLTNCRTTEDLGSSKIKKFQENPWNAWIWWRVPNRLSKGRILTFFDKKLQKISCKTFHRKKLFCLILWLCLQPFVEDCRWFVRQHLWPIKFVNFVHKSKLRLLNIPTTCQNWAILTGIFKHIKRLSNLFLRSCILCFIRTYFKEHWGLVLPKF